jgi:DNA-directed RNA polymerase II subunit RPB2
MSITNNEMPVPVTMPVTVPDVADEKVYMDVETPWHFISSYFSGNGVMPATRAVKHQIESYNDFIGHQLMRTIEMFNVHRPIYSKKERAANQEAGIITDRNHIEIYVKFKNLQIDNPQMFELNGTKVILNPNDARLRNFTYSSSMYLDIHVQTIVHTGENMEQTQIFNKVLNHIHIGKMPIMLKSDICMVTKYVNGGNSPDSIGECTYDTGGYFIINGNEKSVIAQERAAENKIYVYPVKTSTKYILQAEIKSVPDGKCISPKQINIMVCSKSTGFGHPIVIQIPRIKIPIPIVTLFRALGVIADKDICDCIFLNIDTVLEKGKRNAADCMGMGDIEKIQNGANVSKRNMALSLHASIVSANKYLTEEECFHYITNQASFTSTEDVSKEVAYRRKREFTAEILQNDLFPHCATKKQKICFLGIMVQKLLAVHIGIETIDDRDTYLNKRLDLTGILINNLFRTSFNRFVKDMEYHIIKEIDGGSWRTKGTGEYENIINDTNLSKIFRSTIIDTNLKRALSTGDFSVKNSTSNKAGVAQVLNRLNYISSLSHLRRVSTPNNKNDKLIPPRKLHNTSIGFMCPAETPEGQSVGVVKNLAYMCHITIPADSTPIHAYLKDIHGDPLYGYYSIDLGFGPPPPHGEPIQEGTEGMITSIQAMYEKVKVFINGAWVGVVLNDPIGFYHNLKQKKYYGVFNIYTSIVFNIAEKEIVICLDAGRVSQPLFRINPQTRLPYFNETVVAALKKGIIQWDDLLISHEGATPFDPLCGMPSIVEYVDADEKNTILICDSLANLVRNRHSPNPIRYTHCEIHASSVYGVTAACIPFPQMNQSPRNAYQSAQAKQAAGTYVTNYHERMDKSAYVLAHPQRPLIETRLMNILKLHEIPWGSNVTVAIMTFTGYNQEDSIIMKKSFADRGGLNVFMFHTEKDEEKQKINGDEEIRCKPNPAITKKMKFGNYAKLNNLGLIPENTLIENDDIIIAKVTPIKENRNDETQKIKFEDHSKIYHTSEETYVDKNYMNKNGDGYMFAKVRLRTLRKPGIGDKFSSRAGQKGTVGLILPDADMPFTANGITPDIIINPHAIPSRMTIAQLMETLMGKALVELGMFGDGTPFGDLTVNDVSEMLVKLGKESYGNELLHNPFTGEQHDCSVFMGPVFYHRLKHMVNDKMHSRGFGPTVNLTRQPMEGRARDGGLRFGEMERDAAIAHGAAAFTRERLYEASDKYEAFVCTKCGIRAVYNDSQNIHTCRFCNNAQTFKRVEIPYALKLLEQELQTMNIGIRYITKE